MRNDRDVIVVNVVVSSSICVVCQQKQPNIYAVYDIFQEIILCIC